MYDQRLLSYRLCATTVLMVPVLLVSYAVVPVLAAHQSEQILGRKAYRSPDRTRVATVVSLKQLASYGENPSRVEIRSASGRLLASRDHSGDIDEGFTVDKAAWTADSRCFVYQVENSGGHSPWHIPIFFYSRRRGKFYSLDHALERLNRRYAGGDGCITSDFKLEKPCAVITEGRVYANSFAVRKRYDRDGGDGTALMIDLGRLEKILIREDEVLYDDKE